MRERGRVRQLAAGGGQRRLQQAVEIARGWHLQQAQTRQGAHAGDDADNHRGAMAGRLLVGHALSPEGRADQGAEGQQHPGRLEAKVDDVVRQHGHYPSHQRGLDAISARLFPEPTCDQNPKAQQQNRGHDSGFDEDAERLVLDELEPIDRRQGLVDGINAAKGAKTYAGGMGGNDGQGILRQRELGHIVANRAAKLVDDPIATEPDGEADDNNQCQEDGREPAAMQWLAFVGSWRKGKPGQRAHSQGKHRSPRQGGNSPGGKDPGKQFPDALSVACRSGKGKGQGGEGREFEELGGVVGVDEGTDHQAPACVETPKQQVFVEGAVAKPHCDRQ